MLRRLALVLALMAAAGCDSGDLEASRLVLRNATVIDGTGAPPQSGLSVAVEDGRIVQIGTEAEVEAGEGAGVLDLTGRWLLPGFVDVHTHLPEPALHDEVLRTFLAFGITSIRNPAAFAPDRGVDLRERIAAGEVLGPELRTAGWLINRTGSGFGVEVGTEAEIRAVVREQAAAGVDVVKLYVGLEPDLVAAGIDEAHRLGVPLVGHLGETTWGEATELGIDQLTHSAIWGLAHSVVPEAERAAFADFYTPNGAFSPALFAQWAEVVDADGPATLALAQTLRDNGVSFDPNLVLAEAVFWGDDPNALERLEPGFAPNPQAASWSVPHPYSQNWSPSHRADAKEAFPLFLDLIRVFHEQGVRLTVGTDTENPWMTPGVAFHRELELLVAAGIPPLDVLTLATRNGAEAAGIADAGTIEVGKQADFVVLTANPLDDIRHTRRIDHVVRDGEVLDPGDLLR